MKIAFFHELPYGGARRAVLEFGIVLKRNHQVDLFYVDDVQEAGLEKIFNAVYFKKFKSRKWQGNDWRAKLYKDTVELFKIYTLHKNIAKEIDKNKYDFVFVHGSKYTQAPFILRFLKTKKIYYCQEPLRIVYDDFLLKEIKTLAFMKKYYEKMNRSIRKKIDRTNLNGADMILANSKFSKKWIKNAYKKKSIVCYLGVNVDLFKPLKFEKNHDILFLGQKNEIEGYDILEDTLKLFSKKPKVKIIERNGEGRGIEDSKLVKEYNRAKIVVCLSRNEPFGLIPIESASCGVPVVALNEGGFKESVIPGTTGYLVNRNIRSIFVVLKRLLENDSLRKKMETDARKNAELNWTWEKSAENLLNIYKKEE